MKPLIAALSFLAIAINTTVASISGFAYCVDRETGALCETANGGASETSTSCCSPVDARGEGIPSLPPECENCIDLAIEANEDIEAAPTLERVIVKGPHFVEWLSLEYLHFIRREPDVANCSHVRMPLVAESGASRQYASTVQFRC